MFKLMGTDFMLSLRQKIAFLMGASSLFALLTGGALTIVHFESKVHKQSALELGSISRNTPAMIEAVCNGLASLGRTAALTSEVRNSIRNGKPEELFLFLVKFLNVNHLDYTEVTDASGIVIVNMADSLICGQPSTNPLVPIANSGSPFGYGIIRENDQLYVAATLPITDEKGIMGTITVGNLFDRKLMQKLASFQGVDLALWKDPDQSAIVPLGKDPLPPISQILEGSEIAELVAGKTIIKNVKFGDSTLQCAFFVQPELGSPRLDFYASYRSMRFLQEAWGLSLIHLTALFFLIIILVVYSALWFSKRVTKPLVELAELAGKLADMDFNEQVPVKGRDEISELARSFNNLARALKNNIAKKDQYATELAKLNEGLEQQVAARTEELEHSNLRLKREISEKNDFLRTVSHDLGAPLRNIGGLTHMLEKKYGDSLGEEGKDRLERIRNNVSRELEMIEQLLELSRLKTRRQKKQIVDLMELLAQIRQDLTYSIEEKGIHLVVLDVLPSIWAERDRIRQLFQNLIDNAIKYMGDNPEPEIAIGWSENPKAHLFWVKDNGIGIPNDQREKIFGVFKRVKTKEVNAVEGKGVGLASVKTIVELYGGEIWVESQVGSGSTFYFTFNRSIVDPEIRGEETIQTEAEEELAGMYAEDSAN